VVHKRSTGGLLQGMAETIGPDLTHSQFRFPLFRRNFLYVQELQKKLRPSRGTFRPIETP
jgi:hypothetical protein